MRSENGLPERATEHSEGPLNAGGFMTLVHRQAEIFRQLRRMTEQQKEYVSHEDPSRLISLLADRRKLTDELGLLGRRLDPVKNHWKQFRMELSEDQRHETESLLEEVRNSLKAIMTSDQLDIGRLMVRKRQVSSQMRNLPPRGGLVSAYGAPPKSSVPGIDRTDETS